MSKRRLLSLKTRWTAMRQSQRWTRLCALGLKAWSVIKNDAWTIITEGFRLAATAGVLVLFAKVALSYSHSIRDWLLAYAGRPPAMVLQGDSGRWLVTVVCFAAAVRLIAFVWHWCRRCKWHASPYSFEFSPEWTQSPSATQYVQGVLERSSSFRDSKENLAVAAVVLFLGVVAYVYTYDPSPATSPGSPKPMFHLVKNEARMFSLSLVWLLTTMYVRYQLRLRRWAALRVAGCEWLLAEGLPGRPKDATAFAKWSEERGATAQPFRPSPLELFCDTVVWPVEGSVSVLAPLRTPNSNSLEVYPRWLTYAWLVLQYRGTDTILHERIVQIVLVLGYFAIWLRVLTFPL